MPAELIKYSEILKVCGIPKNQIEIMVAELTAENADAGIAVLERPGEIHLVVTAEAETEKEAAKKIKPVVRGLKARLGVKIYTTDENKTLETVVVELLKNQKLTLTTVESCTGGALSARIVDVPGASEVLKQGFITYSNKAKKRFIMVKKSTLKKHGAVSEKCAKEMAKGGTFVTGSDAAVSVTGLAGPDGGTEETPVGTVFIGCDLKGKTYVKEYHFEGDRSSVREQAVVNALELLREAVLENLESGE